MLLEQMLLEQMLLEQMLLEQMVLEQNKNWSMLELKLLEQASRCPILKWVKSKIVELNF